MMAEAVRGAEGVEVRRITATADGPIVLATTGQGGSPAFLGLGARCRDGIPEVTQVALSGTGRPIRPNPAMNRLVRRVTERLAAAPGCGTCEGLLQAGDDWADRVATRITDEREHLFAMAAEIGARLGVPPERAWQDERLRFEPGLERYAFRAIGRGRLPLALDPILFPTVFFGVPAAVFVRRRKR
jgi:hypothetical protein